VEDPNEAALVQPKSSHEDAEHKVPTEGTEELARGCRFDVGVGIEHVGLTSSAAKVRATLLEAIAGIIWL
jgi:hypothetical protein